MKIRGLLACVTFSVAVTHFATVIYADYVPPPTDFEGLVDYYDLPDDTVESDYIVGAVLNSLYGAVDITTDVIGSVKNKIVEVVDRTETKLFDWFYIVDNALHLTPLGENLSEEVLSSVYVGGGGVGKGWYPCSDGDFIRIVGGADYPIEVQHSLYSDPIYYAYVGGSSVTRICFAFKHDFEVSSSVGAFKYMYLDDFTTRDFSGSTQFYPTDISFPKLGIFNSAPIFTANIKANYFDFNYSSLNVALDDFFNNEPTPDIPYRDVPTFPTPRDVIYNKLPTSGVYNGDTLYYPTYNDIYYPSLSVDDIILPSYDVDMDFEVSVPLIDRVGLNTAFSYIPLEFIGLAILVLGFLVLGVLL